jgi:hypothetical protein
MRQCVRQIGRSINFLNMASDEHTSGSSPNPVAVYCPIAERSAGFLPVALITGGLMFGLVSAG